MKISSQSSYFEMETRTPKRFVIYNVRVKEGDTLPVTLNALMKKMLLDQIFYPVDRD